MRNAEHQRRHSVHAAAVRQVNDARSRETQLRAVVPPAAYRASSALTARSVRGTTSIHDGPAMMHACEALQPRAVTPGRSRALAASYPPPKRRPQPCSAYNLMTEPAAQASFMLNLTQLLISSSTKDAD